MKNLLIFLIIILFISCNNTEDKFIGIWMGDKENYYNPNEENSENISLTQGLPILLDFKKENNLTLKVFGAKTFKNIKWKIENDSLLDINNIKYKIQKVTKDTICLELFTRAEKYDYKIYRIKNKKIELDSITIINKLTSGIWSNLKKYPKNKAHLKFENHIEYYKNSVRLLKYNIPLKVYGIKNNTDSIMNVYNEVWSIGKYQDFYFISINDHQFYGSLPYKDIYQITKINNSEFNIYKPQWITNKESNFYKSKPKKDNLLSKKSLVGLWKSKNLENKKYTYYTRKIEESEKYKGNLFYEFSIDQLKIYGIKTDTIICDWYLNRDKTLLFRYNSWEVNNVKGINGETVEIKKFEKDSLELNLFNNNIYNGNNQYRLNINQKFERIKNH